LSDVIDVGAQVRAGSPLCIVHAASDGDADAAIDMVRRAIRIGDSTVADRSVVMERIVQ
jgi:thymidine phosphorylase